MPIRFYKYETTVGSDEQDELPVIIYLRYTPHRAATRGQPAEGGWELDSFNCPVDILEWARLRLIDEAIAAAERDLGE